MWRTVAKFEERVCLDEIGKEVIGLEEEVTSEQETEAGEQAGEGTGDLPLGEPGNLPLPLGEDKGEGRPGVGRGPVPRSLAGETPALPADEVERLRGELAEARTRALASHRRALLAENAGRVVPELVTGSTVEEMEASLEVARRAFEIVRAATMAEIASTPVPAGNPIRQGAVLDGMSPMEKIAYGLKRE